MSVQIQEPEAKEMVTTGAGSNPPVGRILVVDDEPELKGVLVESLQRHGYEVTGCGSGHEALAELRARDFDVLLTDLMMPQTDGIALLKAALEIDPHLVGIVVTGQGTIQTAVDAMQIGAFDYVLKPFRMQTLMPVLTRAMNVRHLKLENVQLRETVAIHSLCQTIAFTLDPQTVLSKLADAALQQSDADEVSILLPTSNRTELYVAAVRGEKRERLLGERVPLQQGISSWVARERQPLILNGAVHDPRFVALWPRPEIRSAISVPMQVANKLVGVINLNVTNRLRPFTLGQMKALSILASTAAAALESASLYALVEQAEKNYRSIFENAVEGIFQATPEGRFITVNPSMARILGYGSPQDLIETVTDISQQLYVDPERRREAGRIQEEQGVVQGFEFEAYRKDRKKIWLSLNRRSIRNESGTEVYREGSVEDITERKRAEAERARLAAEIETHRQRLNSIVASVPGVVWEAWGEPDAANQRIDFVSNYVEQMLGYTVKEWLSTPNFWLSIVHPDDRERTSRLAAEGFATGEGATMEFRWLAKDGRAVWVGSSCVVVMDEQGRPAGLRGVNTDISERKRAEEALRLSESKLTEAQRLAHIGSWNWDLAKNDLTWSDEHYRIFGVEPGDIDVNYEEVVFNFIHPEDRALVRSMIENSIETKEPFNFHYRAVRRDGEERVIQSTGSVETDERGESGRLFGTAQDVTERRRIEQELRQSEERYRDLVENAHDLIYEHDLEGNYTSTNQAAETITGYTVQESLKINIKQTVAPEYLDKAQDMLSRKLAGETVTAYELVILTKDGRRVPVEVNTRLVLHDGVPIGVQGIARDITERKRVEEIQARRAAHALFRADVSAALALSSVPMATTFGLCVTAMVQHLGAAFARVWTLNREEEMLELQASAGMYTHIDGAHSRVPVGTLKIGKIAQERAPHITNNVQTDPRVSNKEWANREGMVAFAGYPLLLDSQLLGVMAMFSREELAEDTLDALASVADLISQGLERRRGEEALRDSEARKRAILESSMDCIITMDHEGLVVDWNPAAEKTFGYTQKETVGRNMAEFIIPERFREKHSKGLKRYLATGEGRILGQRLELTATRRDGAEFPIELTITRIESMGTPIFTGYLRDITERKKAETRLSAQYAVTRVLAESNTISDGASKILQAVCESLGWEYGSLWTVDRGANVLRCSQTWRAPGVQADEFETATRQSVFGVGIGLPGRVWIDSKPAWIADVVTDANFPRAAIAAAVGFHGGCAFPIRFRSEILGVVEFFSRSIRKPDPDLLAMMGTIGSQVGQFIERKRVEEALGESEEQLRQSQKLEAIGQLAGGVAHDFNNLLTAINGYSALALRRLGEDHPIASYLEEIKKAGDRAANLTRQLLAFGRKQLLQPLAINLNDIVGDMIKLLKRLIGEDIQLVTKAGVNLKQIKADPGQLEQVLVNLVVNARDAMPRGGTVTIETANTLLDGTYASRHVGVTPGEYVMLAVSDTGVGMDHDTQSHIFEPFFTTKEKGKGTGLGLSTVYGIVRQSGGNIWVYSEPGRGTTFKVYLPQVDGEITQTDSKAKVMIKRGSETVLLVEDEDMVRNLASQILEETGYRVLAANGGEEALHLFKTHQGPIHLMITDVVMPKMSGKDVADKLKQTHPETKVLFMSGYTDEAIVHHGIVDSHIAFIQKPFSELALTQKIREVLDDNTSGV